MSNRDDIYHELWNPKSLKIRPPGRLFSIEPIGIGTPFTESISSYLNRLAQEHCVTLQKLIMGEIAPLIMGDKYRSEILAKNVSTLFGNSDAKPAINGMRDMTRLLVNALEQLTLRQDLRYLSCLNWKRIIKGRGLFRQDKAWCPQCLEQWQKERVTMYEPLLWSFRDVNFCPQHNCQLIDRCPDCNSPQKAIANNSRLGFCSRCKIWLGKQPKQETGDNIEDNFLNIKGIGDLIAITPSLILPPNLPDLMKKLQLIHFCFERAVNQDLTQFIALGKIMEQLKITVTQHINKPLNLVKLLIPVCDRAKISIAQLLGQDVGALSTIVFGNFKINYRL